MTRSPDGLAHQVAELLKRPTPRLEPDELNRFVGRCLDRRTAFLETTRRHGSPLYILDSVALTARAGRFLEAFSRRLPDIQVFYAMKSNNLPEISAILAGEGLGLDVSSGLELATALDCEARRIMFSGPGKSVEELRLAAAHTGQVTVLMDSFSELNHLEQIAAEAGCVVRAGVRLTTDERGIWRKFGIPLAEVPRFFAEAETCAHVRLCGLQFHLSWNMNPENHVSFITRLGTMLHLLDRRYRRAIEFLDIGGGYWPEEGEWLQPVATPEGALRNIVAHDLGRPEDHYKQAAAGIDEFADRIGDAIRTHLPSDMRTTICTEPGRWLCNDALHILLTVADRKAADLVITDGGTNAVGWERFESDYFPVINLSRPSLDERPCLIAGSLCTPHDLWGYSYFGADIQAGDVLLIPNQGAYTYSLRQHFIKPLPRVVLLEQGGESSPADEEARVNRPS
jgi:diaminopimelate decarboxylase